jgi:hypothetical protein
MVYHLTILLKRGWLSWPSLMGDPEYLCCLFFMPFSSTVVGPSLLHVSGHFQANTDQFVSTTYRVHFTRQTIYYWVDGRTKKNIIQAANNLTQPITYSSCCFQTSSIALKASMEQSYQRPNLDLYLRMPDVIHIIIYSKVA